MDLERELLYLKAQIQEIEEKIRTSNDEKEFDYESDLINKVYEICQDENETSDFLEKVMQVCSLEVDKIILPCELENQSQVKVNQRYHDVFLPKIIDYSIISEVEDTFMEVETLNFTIREKLKAFNPNTYRVNPWRN